MARASGRATAIQQALAGFSQTFFPLAQKQAEMQQELTIRTALAKQEFENRKALEQQDYQNQIGLALMKQKPEEVSLAPEQLSTLYGISPEQAGTLSGVPISKQTSAVGEVRRGQFDVVRQDFQRRMEEGRTAERDFQRMITEIKTEKDLAEAVAKRSKELSKLEENVNLFEKGLAATGQYTPEDVKLAGDAKLDLEKAKQRLQEFQEAKSGIVSKEKAVDREPQKKYTDAEILADLKAGKITKEEARKRRQQR